MSTNPDSVSCRSFPGRLSTHTELYRQQHNNNVTFHDSTSTKSVSTTIVTATGSSHWGGVNHNNNNVITSVLGGGASASTSAVHTSGQPITAGGSKRHSFGYRLRRWFRNTTGSVGKHRTSQRDLEAGRDSDQNFIRHTASLYSTSSAESEHHSRIHSSKSRKSHRRPQLNDEIHVIHNEFTNFFTGGGSSGGKKKTRTESANSSVTIPGTGTINPQSAINAQPSTSSQANGPLSNPTTSSAGAAANTSTNPSLNTDSRESFECPICLLDQPVANFPELLTCHHRVCLSCLKQYLKIEICESRILLTCTLCVELLHPNDIQTILSSEPKLLEKYEAFMIRRYLITEQDARWCPAPDCNFCVIATGCASCPKLQCGRKSCETLFCYHCKQHWHADQTCDQARESRYRAMYPGNGSGNHGGKSPDISSRYGSSRRYGNSNGRNSNASSPDGPFTSEDMKPCPCCKVLIVKMDDGSCNHMTCSVCGTEFCWLCMQKISDLHYLSPSGCTFWGKKPWSRKKKIMWQLGMLVGAPVGIALIAGIAVPAIIIGIPVWVGRKLHARFERNMMSRTRSNLLVTAGVVTSVFVSPILAAVAVGIGVPILLAYVYGVVPISLCRSGGCGVTTSGNGVKFDMDDDEISANGAHADGFSIDTALSGHGGSRRIANPSIGEMSLGLSASLSIGSNSHLDRLTATNGQDDRQIDRESSSIQACAGSIASA